MTDKDKLLEIYNKKEYQIYTIGSNNKGQQIIYKNPQVISFVKYFTRLLSYGTKRPDEYIANGYPNIVFQTEALLNDAIDTYLNNDEIKIDFVLNELLNLNSDWLLNWSTRPMFEYTLNTIYNNETIDNKEWGW